MSLPKKVYVYFAEDIDKEPVLLVTETPEEAAPDIGETRQVGIYELTRTTNLTTSVSEDD